MIELSLFKDDPLHRFFRKVGLEKDGITHKGYLALIVFVAGWLIPLILSAIEGHAELRISKESFLCDINFPVQVFVIIFLIFVEDYFDHYIKNADLVLRNSGLIGETDTLEKAIRKVTHWRTSIVPEIGLIILGITIPLFWEIPMFGRNAETWQTHTYGGIFTFTASGWWIALTFGPLVHYCWVRWLWKAVIWTMFLYHISRTRLKLAVGHPDRVGGLRFLGDIQAGFGILIFAVGLIVVAAAFKGISFDNMTIYDFKTPILAFVVLAPLTFLAPLLMFTMQLYEAKLEGILQYDILLTRFINAYENQHLSPASIPSDPLSITQDLFALSGIVNLSDHVAKMRIVPFDLKTLFRLFVSAASPMLPLLPEILTWSKLSTALEVYFK
jgi:hypothetical protein